MSIKLKYIFFIIIVILILFNLKIIDIKLNYIINNILNNNSTTINQYYNYII